MIWTETLLLIIRLKLITQPKIRIIKNINIITIIAITIYIYNNTNSLLKPTWTHFIQIWIIIRWNISI